MKAIEYENMIRERAEAEGWEAGLAAGKAAGKAEGEIMKLISLVSKKINKGKSVAEIANELEEEEDNIAFIYNIASKYCPEYETDKIYDDWKRSQKL